MTLRLILPFGYLADDQWVKLDQTPNELFRRLDLINLASRRRRADQGETLANRQRVGDVWLARCGQLESLLTWQPARELDALAPK